MKETVIKSIKLSALAGLVQDAVSTAFSNELYWVIAEISEFKKYPDRGYAFLTLVEKENGMLTAKMEAAIWRQQYSLIHRFEQYSGISLDKDIQVLLQVKPVFHPQYGLRLVVYDADAGFTIGKIELERQKVLQMLLDTYPRKIRLQDGRYIGPNHLLKLPTVIKKIALITAPSSDGLHDFLHELESNIFGYRFSVDLYLCQIQGKNAESGIVSQMEAIETHKELYDLVVLVRGGGSQVDFGPFDQYVTAEKTALFPIPVIAGIGHHRNISAVDLLAHAALKTPTKAASFIVDHNRMFEEKMIALRNNCIRLCNTQLMQHKQKLNLAGNQLRNSVLLFFERKKQKLREFGIVLHHANPDLMLERGYALLIQDGKILENISDINLTKKAQLLMKGGEADITVNDIIQTA